MQANDLSYEIEKYEHNNRRMVPKLVKVTFQKIEGWRVIFDDPIALFHISTKTLAGQEWRIQRSYKDFEVLRQYLLEQHPDCIVPTLPPIQPSRDSDEYEYWGKLGNLIVQFLEHCFLAPSLKYNKLLCNFIVKDQPLS